jgi:hypothetical protein
MPAGYSEVLINRSLEYIGKAIPITGHEGP